MGICGALEQLKEIKPINLNIREMFGAILPVDKIGGLAEWFMALVLKTSGRKPSQVRILHPPPSF